MTEEQIEKMEPGRELDWEVAQIMGVRKEIFNFAYEAGNYNYSTDIAAAWEVFEKFGFQGYIGFSGAEYFCEIMNGWNDSGSVYGISEDCSSAPEAVCKAALLALMEG